MVWAKRTEPAPPSLAFDRLNGWRLEVQGGAQAVLQASQAQNLWGRPVARLRYQGNGEANSSPQVLLMPPLPVRLPNGADVVELWVYGNRWDWVNPPDVPPVTISLRLRDGVGDLHTVLADKVRWEEWWLLHRRLPSGLPEPVSLEALEISRGWQRQPREIYFDSVRFYREDLRALSFQPRPRRNLTLAQGQSAGANTGPGRLPFPTREQTILPVQLGGRFQTWVKGGERGGYLFAYRGKDGAITYHFDPAKGLSGIAVELDGRPVGRLLDGACVRRVSGSTNWALTTTHRVGQLVRAEYGDGTSVDIRIWQKSLVIDVRNDRGSASALEFGQVTGATEPQPMVIPYLTYGSSHPLVLRSRAGPNRAYSSLWLDWYRSNGSEPYGVRPGATNVVQINGGVRYYRRTDGRLNPMWERLFLTVSPRFEEVLPTVPNPVGRHAASAAGRLWQESWGPDDFGKQMKRSERLRAYGIEKLIQCNHEIAWRDGGESFTLRLHAAPKKGGDEALKRYVRHQRRLGWFAGLYSNYTDYAPVNGFWDPDNVQRAANGDWKPAWPRCWALKPLRAVELDRRLAPEIKRLYGPNSAYTDVHTAVAPWGYNDLDARVPGAGTFAQTFYAYGELLRNDSRVYRGPVFSEGTYQWLYAGLADGNYALAYNGRPLAKEPLLPVFDLLQIHPKECDIGIGWTASFCDGIPNWRAPENLDRAIDRFLLHTLAYGHIGWLVEEEHGLARTCRSYYMLQAVQARYGLRVPRTIAYWDGTSLHDVSTAVGLGLPESRRQLYVAYPGGLKLWCNDHPTEVWQVRLGDRSLSLPPAGWAAYTAEDDLVSYSALVGTNQVDYLRCGDYTYLDGRGSWFSTPEAASDGGLAMTPLRGDRVQVIRISGDGAFTVKRPYNRTGRILEIAAYDVESRRLSAPEIHDTGTETRIQPVKNAIRYVLTFRSALSQAPGRAFGP